MKKIFKNGLAGLIIFVLLMGLVTLPGCSSAIKVERDHDAVVSEILKKAKEEGKAAIANSPDIEDCDVYLEGKNELVYEYLYKNNIDLNEDQRANMQTSIDRIISSIFDTIKQELSIDDLKVTYRFLNKDKTVAFESKYDDEIVSKIKSEAEKLKAEIVPKTKEEIDKVLKDTKDAMYDAVMANDTYSNFEIYLNEKNEVVFEYLFKDGLSFDKSKFDDAKKIVDNIVLASYSSMQSELGITDLVIVFRFLKSDGTVVYKLIYDEDVVDSLLG